MFPSIFNRIRFMKTFLASLGGLVNVKSENSSFECWREHLFAFYEVEAVLKLVEWWVLNVVININIRQKKKNQEKWILRKSTVYILPIYEVKACKIFHFSKCLGPPKHFSRIAWLPVGKYRAESILTHQKMIFWKVLSGDLTELFINLFAQMNHKKIAFEIKILTCILLVRLCRGLASRLYINESYEYKLRRELLTNMDVMVRPVESPSDIVSVDFSMTIRSLSDLVSQNPNGKKSHYWTGVILWWTNWKENFES